MISIIVPVYRAEKDLGRCVDSDNYSDPDIHGKTIEKARTHDCYVMLAENCGIRNYSNSEAADKLVSMI